jgi:limonene-1,2-epoxide hydrolase
MIDMQTETGPQTVIENMKRAVDDHDLDALGECFHPDYLSEQPFHPDRTFRGREQMRKNWTQIFQGVPDIQADVLRYAVDGNTIWTEWAMHGTRFDGVPANMAMVTIGGVEDGQIVWMRLYLEPVTSGAGIDASVREQMAPQGSGGAPNPESASPGGNR